MKYYWIDKSCDGVKGYDFENYIKEAQLCAQIALKRLESNTDTDFARVFNIIYKTPKTNPAKYPFPDAYFRMNAWSKRQQLAHGKRTILSHVLAALKDFGTDWARTDDRTKADVRLYNDPSRWVHNQNTGHSENLVNHMVSHGNVHTFPASARAFTTFARIPYDVVGFRGPLRPDFRENAKRVTIDFRPPAWGHTLFQNDPPSMAVLEERIAKVAVLRYPSTLNMSDCLTMLTFLTAHEFMHSPAYGFDDGPNSGNPSVTRYGWEHVMSEQKDETWHDAEAFACLLIAAGLSEVRPYGEGTGGYVYTLDRSWDQMAGSNDLNPFPGYVNGQPQVGFQQPI